MGAPGLPFADAAGPAVAAGARCGACGRRIAPEAEGESRSTGGCRACAGRVVLCRRRSLGLCGPQPLTDGSRASPPHRPRVTTFVVPWTRRVFCVVQCTVARRLGIRPARLWRRSAATHLVRIRRRSYGTGRRIRVLWRHARCPGRRPDQIMAHVILVRRRAVGRLLGVAPR